MAAARQAHPPAESSVTVTPIIFEGGPQDGKNGMLDDLRHVVTVAWMPPLPLLDSPPPRPRWWRHPLKWARWKPPPLPELPEPQQLAYRDTGERRNGRRVFAIASDWPWFKGPCISDDGDLYRALATACYTVHPMVRQDSLTRWVMDLGWYRRIRAVADPDGDNPEKWQPDPEDMLLGIRITVIPDGGAPHLENRRYPDGYGARPLPHHGRHRPHLRRPSPHRPPLGSPGQLAPHHGTPGPLPPRRRPGIMGQAPHRTDHAHACCALDNMTP